MQTQPHFFLDDHTIRHPAFVLGGKDGLLFLQDEWDTPFVLQLSPGESPDLFDPGSVMDADGLQRVTDPEQLEMIQQLREELAHAEG